jgi:hypothetical protein
MIGKLNRIDSLMEKNIQGLKEEDLEDFLEFVREQLLGLA